MTNSTTIDCYESPEEKEHIFVACCTKDVSIGALALKPHGALAKHNRPVAEQLRQMIGSCVMKLFDGDIQVDEITLHEGDELVIPATQYHIHSNPFDEPSVTMWKFEGDITEVIAKIGASFKQI